MGNPHVAIPWIAVLTPARSGDTTSRRRWWCDPGNCYLQPRIGSIGPDTVFFIFLCEHSWDTPGENFAIFQRCHNCFQRTEADIQLRTQFITCNSPICADELIETFAWLSGTWFVIHVAVATAETRHPPPHYANVHYLVSINVQQASMNVIGWNFFRMEECNYTPLLHTHFHVRRHFVSLPVYCHLLHGNKF